MAESIRETKVQGETTVRVRLPVGGWQVGFLVKPDGRTAVEVVDTDGWRTVLAVSTDQPMLSDLPRTFRTAYLWLIHAADCRSRYSS